MDNKVKKIHHGTKSNLGDEFDDLSLSDIEAIDKKVEETVRNVDVDNTSDLESAKRAKVAQETTEEVVETPPVPERYVPGKKVSEELAEEALERPVREGAKEAVEGIMEEVVEDAARASTERTTVRATAEGIEEIAQHTHVGKGIVVGGIALAAGTFYFLSQRSKRKRRKRDGISLDSQASQMHYYS